MEKDKPGKEDSGTAKNQRTSDSSSRANQQNHAQSRNQGSANGNTVSSMIANSSHLSSVANINPIQDQPRDRERSELSLCSGATASSSSLTELSVLSSSSSGGHIAPIVPVSSAPIAAAPVAGQTNAPHNWQSTKTTIKDRLAYVFNTEIMGDIHFLVGKPPNVQQIPAHKFVLSVGSAVFDAQFNGPMATRDSVIEIPDVEPSAFIALLRFLYSDEVTIGPETVMTTLYTAKKYAVPALEKACVEFLKRNLSSDNAFMLLTQARLFDEPQLAALCLESIDKSTSEALNADGFTDIDHETLCAVLERDTLGIRECKLCAAVFRWAEAECLRRNLQPTPENQRHVLGRALQLIRFPLMSIEEFAVGPAQSGILEDREVVQLFLYFTVNPKPSIHFQVSINLCQVNMLKVVSLYFLMFTKSLRSRRFINQILTNETARQRLEPLFTILIAQRLIQINFNNPNQDTMWERKRKTPHKCYAWRARQLVLSCFQTM